MKATGINWRLISVSILMQFSSHGMCPECAEKYREEIKELTKKLQ